MIKTVIFDIGNVMMTWNWELRMKELLGEKAASAVTAAIMGGGNWNELDRGTRTIEGVARCAVQKAPEYEKQIYLAVEHIPECALRCEYAIPWVEELHGLGYTVLYLSNYSRDLICLRPDVLDFVPYMDGGIFSWSVRMTKPEPEIYAKLCDTYDQNPAEALFIDDNADNIAAARRFGLNAIQFRGYETTYPEVMEILARSRA